MITLTHTGTEQRNEFADREQAQNFLANVESPADWTGLPADEAAAPAVDDGIVEGSTDEAAAEQPAAAPRATRKTK